MLPHCDFLSINCPASPETHHFLDQRRIALLPDRAVVVNTARGPIVDDRALIDALTSGKLAAAGLDVFEGEPKIHEDYYGLDNAFLLPHMGSATVETRNAMGFKCLDNLDAFFAGRGAARPRGLTLRHLPEGGRSYRADAPSRQNLPHRLLEPQGIRGFGVGMSLADPSWNQSWGGAR